MQKKTKKKNSCIVNSNMSTDIKITSLVAVVIDFQENGSSSKSDREFYTSTMSLAIAVYHLIHFSSARRER